MCPPTWWSRCRAWGADPRRPAGAAPWGSPPSSGSRGRGPSCRGERLVSETSVPLWPGTTHCCYTFCSREKLLSQRRATAHSVSDTVTMGPRRVTSQRGRQSPAEYWYQSENGPTMHHINHLLIQSLHLKWEIRMMHFWVVQCQQSISSERRWIEQYVDEI